MTLLTLANEIQKWIVDYVAPNATGLFVGPDLLSLMLTHSHFHLLAEDYVQKHKHYLHYRFMVLGHADNETEWLKRRTLNRPLDLIRLIHDDPNIVSYIHSIRYQVSSIAHREPLSDEDHRHASLVAGKLMKYSGFFDAMAYDVKERERLQAEWVTRLSNQEVVPDLFLLLSLLPNITKLGLRQSEVHWASGEDVGILLRSTLDMGYCPSDHLKEHASFLPLAELRVLEFDNIIDLSDALFEFRYLPHLEEIHLRSYQRLSLPGHEWDYPGIKTVLLYDCHCHRPDTISELLDMFPNLKRLACCCTGRLSGRQEQVYHRLGSDENLQQVLLESGMRMSFESDSKGSGFAFKDYGYPLIDKPSGMA